MNRYDINLLPWYERRQQRWSRQRSVIVMALIMGLGWWACGALWQQLWRNEYARQRLAQLQQYPPHSTELNRERALLAAEQWRQHESLLMQQRAHDQTCLAALWHALSTSGIAVHRIDLQRDQWLLDVDSSATTELARIARNAPPTLACHVLSATQLQCVRQVSEGDEPSHD